MVCSMSDSRYKPSIAIYMTQATYDKLKSQVAMRAMVGDVDVETWAHDKLAVAYIQAVEEGGTSPIFLRDENNGDSPNS